ncbi:BON domain-containing protein [Caldimonas brevitalea]|uniref:BON domain-containing protein n=1 Tax=Caldimonas brevitalea TaxID=413882 RepID=A0A0G3BDQ1_9BURK|nr:BON domain-containing protein [Caldimonas brevitalea]AKJ27549.1 hypothetical protein AAW51_0858 [Caldimonas brevitalea]
MRYLFSTLVRVAVGAAAMYYLDPVLGRRRRALLRDKAIAISHDVREVAHARAKRAVDRAQGLVAVTRARLDGSVLPTSDRQLCERVRAQLGRMVSHARAVDVEARAGRVCLRGNILAAEVDRLLATVSSMPGVEAVDNQLSVHETAGNIPDLQGTGRPGRGAGTGALRGNGHGAPS